MDLSYFNARMRGSRAALLKASDYESLLSAHSYESLVGRLKGTIYGTYLEAAERGGAGRGPSGGTSGGGELVLEAARRSLGDFFEGLFSKGPKEAEAYLRVLVGFWEVYNLKCVVRAIVKGVSREELRSILLPAGEFNSAAIKELSSSVDLDGIKRLLRSWSSPYAQPFEDGLKAFKESARLEDFEHSLDLFLFGYMRSFKGGLAGGGEDRAVIRTFAALKTDSVNIMTLLKVAGSKVGEGYLRGIFVSGGRSLRLQDFLLCGELSSRDELAANLSVILRYSALRDVVAGVEYDALDLLEERLDDLITKELKRLAIINPLSIAVPLSVASMKVREIKNLRLIERGRLFDIPRGELTRFLYYS